MISRRSFMKLGGLAAASAGAGFATESLLRDNDSRRYAIHGFLPADRASVADVVRAFTSTLPGGFGKERTVIFADVPWKKVIGSALDDVHHQEGSGELVIRIAKLGAEVPADILIADDRKHVHRPDIDFPYALATVRSEMQGRSAGLLFSAEYRDTKPFSSLLAAGSVAVIEGTDGIVDRIHLDGIARKLAVKGPQGSTGITVGDGGVRVHSSSCRHKRCEHAGFISRPGDFVACAPNRVLISIERA